MYTMEDYIKQHLIKALDQNENKERFFLSICMSYKIIEPSGIDCLYDSKNYILKHIPIINAGELYTILHQYPFMKIAKVISVTNTYINDIHGINALPDILIHGLLETNIWRSI